MARILKETRHVIAPILRIIFCSSLQYKKVLFLSFGGPLISFLFTKMGIVKFLLTTDPYRLQA